MKKIKCTLFLAVSLFMFVPLIAQDAEESVEEEKTELEAQMSSGNFSTLPETTKRYKEVCQILESKYARWEELAERA